MIAAVKRPLQEPAETGRILLRVAVTGLAHSEAATVRFQMRTAPRPPGLLKRTVTVTLLTVAVAAAVVAQMAVVAACEVERAAGAQDAV